jgi:hypothetical protein
MSDSRFLQWLRHRAWIIVVILAIAVIALMVARHQGWVTLDDIDLVLVALILALLLLPFGKSVTAGPFSFTWSEEQQQALDEEVERKEETARQAAAEMPDIPQAGAVTVTIDGFVFPESREELEREIKKVYIELDKMLQRRAKQQGDVGSQRELRETTLESLGKLERGEWRIVADIRWAILFQGGQVDVVTMRDALAAGYDLRGRLERLASLDATGG